MKKDNEIRLSITQVSDATGFARATLYRYVQTGELLRDKNGLISLNRPENRKWFRENGIDPDTVKAPKPRYPGRRPAGAPAPVKTEPEGESRAELQRLHLKKKIQKLSIGIERERGRLLDIERVRFSVFFYLDRIYGNLERLSNSFLDDTATGIVKAGGLTAEVRHAWKAKVLEEIDGAKNETVKRLEKLSKGEVV